MSKEQLSPASNSGQPDHFFEKQFPEGRSGYAPAELLRIGGIVGMHYTQDIPSDTCIIYGIGAPIPPDNGTLPDAPIIFGFGIDIFVPDYIGYGRSDGIFTPQNCIRTFTVLYDKFTSGCEGHNSYLNTSKHLIYKRVLIVGRSLGATYAPVLPRFNQNIREVAILCPVVESKSQGSMPGEETNELFLRSMKEDGYHHLYRGILDPLWIDHLENKDDLSPMDNIRFLSNVRLFIGHGMKDAVVHYSKSVRFHQMLCEAFPQYQNNFKLMLYPDGEHGKSTTNPAMHDFLKWLELTK